MLGSERMMTSARRILEVMRTGPSAPDTGQIMMTPRALRHGLSIERVLFKCGSACFALRDASMHVAPGEAVALVGPQRFG